MIWDVLSKARETELQATVLKGLKRELNLE